MIRTEHSVRLLQAVAVIAGLAVLLWSLGLPSLRFADAANLTDISDTLSDSAPSVVSNHSIEFTIPSGGTELTGTDTITITFPDGASDFDLSSIDAGDIDFATTTATGDYTLGSGVNEVDVSTSTFAITFTLGANVVIATGTPVYVEVGDSATFGGTGNGQIVNPTVGSYEINIETSDGSTLDTGAARVAIVDDVDVTASVDTTFTFAVAGIDATGGGETVGGEAISGSTTATAIPLGRLDVLTATTVAQDLTVTTNANQGYTVTAQVDGSLQSSTGADIDGFDDGAYSDTPTTWSVPFGDVNDENTWGHWGITSDDGTTTRAAPDEFDDNEWIGPTTTARVVMGHDGPADGTTAGVGTARIGFRTEITALQESGDDYEAVLTYVATPIF